MFNRISTLALSAFLFSACGGSTDRIVSGQLDVNSFKEVGASLVALNAAGERVTVDVGVDGKFTIALPVGRAYAFAFKNASNQPFAQVVFGGSEQMTSRVFLLEGEQENVGVVRPEAERADAVEGEPRMVRGERDLLETNARDEESHDGDALADSDGNMQPDSMETAEAHEAREAATRAAREAREAAERDGRESGEANETHESTGSGETAQTQETAAEHEAREAATRAAREEAAREAAEREAAEGSTTGTGGDDGR